MKPSGHVKSQTTNLKKYPEAKLNLVFYASERWQGQK